ncbi:MAG: type I restriction enzyme HsdR N-terminal domain-containing protein [Gemmatimonadota bacterium]|nr:type I restriction enzyme HsdR N-terminal domain-containing protein [Gemmatimonadota bacterium]
MQSLNFPRQYEFDIRASGGKRTIFDPLRRKHVRLTPEEWVRQNLVQHLVQDLGYPAGRTAVETAFAYGGMQHRADVIVYSGRGEPVLMAECKAPDVRIKQQAFDQIARYNTSVGTDYLVVTNGITHYCYALDREERSYRFLDSLPRYEDL